MIVIGTAKKEGAPDFLMLGGAIMGDPQYMEDHLRLFLRHTGPTLSAFNAWVLLKGLETLELRIKAHCENATKVAWSRMRQIRPRGGRDPASDGP